MQSKWPSGWRLVGIAGWLMLAGNSGMAVESGWAMEHAPLWPGGAADAGWRAAPLPGGDLVVFGETTDDRHGSDLIVFRLAASTGERLWERRIDGPNSGANTALGLAVDASGHIAIAGTTSDDRDLYTARLSAEDGSILWEKTYSNPVGGYDQPRAIATFANGDIVVSGYTRNTGSFDIITLRYAAADGAELWQRSFNGAENFEDAAEALAVDAAGDVIVAGYTDSSSGADYYVGKLDGLTGSPVWEVVHAGTGGGDDFPRALALDAAGNPVVSGVSSNGVNDDILTVKFSTEDGAVLWERRYNGPADRADGPRGVAVGAGGDVFVAGSSQNATDYDRYLARYAGGDGSLVWENRYNGPANSNDLGRALVLDAQGNPVVTGNSFNGIDFDFDTSKHDAATGAPLWTASYAGPSGGDDVPWSLALDGAGNAIAAGRSSNGRDNDFVTISLAGTDGAQRWVNRYDGPMNYQDERGDIAVDASGNVIITGSSYNGRSYDLVTIKQHATTGAVLWENRYNGPDDLYESPGMVVVDAAGDVYVACSSRNADNEDTYLAKYRGSDGALVWQKRFDGTLYPDSDDWPVAIAIDKWGDLVVLNTSNGSDWYYDFHLAIYASGDGMMLFEARYDSGPLRHCYPKALALDHSSGEMAVTGTVPNPDDNDADTMTLLYSGESGALIWERRFAGPGNQYDSPTDLAIDSAGNVVVTGNTSLGLAIAPRFEVLDIFTAKYAAADGAVLWENVWNGEAASQDSSSCVTIDNQDNVIIGGRTEKYYGDNDYDWQIYVAKYASSTGSTLWDHRARNYNSSGLSDLAVDSDGNIFLVFEFAYDATDNLSYIAVNKLAGQDGSAVWYPVVPDDYWLKRSHYTQPLLALTPGQHVALLANVQHASRTPETGSVLAQPDLFSAVVIESPPPSISLNTTSVTVVAGAEAVITGTFSYTGGLDNVFIWASVGTVTKDDATGVWTWRYSPEDVTDSGTVTVSISDGEHSPVIVEFQLFVSPLTTDPVPVTSAKLHAVGDLPGGIYWSEVRDATKVGNEVRAVGGTSSREGSTTLDTAFLWTSTAGISALPHLVDNPTAINVVIASAITPDGAYIASRARNTADGNGRNAVRVTVSDLSLLDLRQAPFTGSSAANAISEDGSVLYGFGYNASTDRGESFRYNTADNLIEAIPPLFPEDDESFPAGRACSDDGTVMVGTSTDNQADGFDYYGPGNRAFRYKHGQGMSAIPLLPGGSWNMGLAITPNDVLALVLGDSPGAPEGEIYLYNADLGTVRALGTPNPAWRGGNLAGMTANGGVIVANFGTADGSTGASYVRTSSGWHELNAVCTAAGIDLGGWNLDIVLGISDDGTLAWGSGLLNGQRGGWVVEFPPDYLHDLPGIALHAMGDLPGGMVRSEVRDATRVDGVIMAVGGSSQVAGSSGSDTAILWTSTTGMIPIPNLVENPDATNPVFATAITPDGRYIATRTRMSATGGLRQAARVETDTLLPLPLAQPAGYGGSSAANGISDDGSVLYGFGNNNTLAARFHADGSPGVAIPVFDPISHTTNYSAGRGVSADGSVMVGSSGGNGAPGPGFRGFVYEHGPGVSGIPLLPDGTWNSAFAVTPDGRTVLAAGDAPGYPTGAVYLHDRDTGALTALGSPNGSAGVNILGGMTADASVLAGVLVSDYFHNAHGWHSLKDVLHRIGIPLENWGWLSITGISRDGRLVFGQGLHNFASEGFVAEFPEGFLAGYREPETAATPNAAITGAWSSGTPGLDHTFLCLLPTGWFVLYGEALADEASWAADGMERGHFDWDAVSKQLTATTLFDQNGDIGLSGLPFGPSLSVTVSGDSFTAASAGEDPKAFDRVQGDAPILGCWIRDGSDVANGHYTIIAFLPDGTYFHMQEGPAAGGGRSGGEHGTYNWDQGTGMLTVATVTDRNGAWGLNSSSSSAVVIGDRLNSQFSRIAAAPILFADWRELFFTESELADPAVSGAAADFNRDGFANLFHYALGLPPDADASASVQPPAPLFLPALDSTYLTLSLTIPDPSPPDVAYTILESRDLSSWSTLDPAIHTVTLEDNQDGTNRWIVRSGTPVPLNPGEQPLYLRLGVTPTPP